MSQHLFGSMSGATRGLRVGTSMAPRPFTAHLGVRTVRTGPNRLVTKFLPDAKDVEVSVGEPSARSHFIALPVFQPMTKPQEKLELLSKYAALVQHAGGVFYTDETKPHHEPLPALYFVGNGGTEDAMLRMIEDQERAGVVGPVLLIAHPGSNSLPAALETLAALQQRREADGHTCRGRVLYLKSEEGAQQLREAAHDLEVWQQLRRTRMGLVGQPSDWLVASHHSPQAVRLRWGVQLVDVPLDQLLMRLSSPAPSSPLPPQPLLTAPATQANRPCAVQPADVVVGEMAEELMQHSDKVSSDVTPGDVRDALSVYCELKAIAREYNLDCITVRCCDLLTKLHLTGCVAISRLNDEGITAGCEGDVPSAIALLWTALMSQQVLWVANVVCVDEEDNTLLLAHCTVPRALIKRYNLCTHAESGLGVAVEGEVRHTPVTVLRIGGVSLELMWISEGDITDTAGPDEGLCRTHVHVHLHTPGAVAQLLRRPLGNRVVMVPGHWGKRLREWWDLMVAPGAV